MQVNILDIDGTLCPSIFSNDRLQNDNDNCLTDEFLHDLLCVKPYAWVEEHATRGFFDHHTINVVITGRMRDHQDVTERWFREHTHAILDQFVSVQWDDSLATREESYADYVPRKWRQIDASYRGFTRVSTFNGFPFECRVVEDDEAVLRCLLHYSSVPRECLWVVRGGNEPIPYTVGGDE